ncbi:hypothetical protein HNP84_000527 [Thermocatellispora tengchongensis]|uniref:Uncharacterized protein n=1 Tax=Thermocatellispora tengchongensis TaxID=1073253 RepID=A0A840NVJ9_9ACTN|nr:hypothetical protein [Thermocatellispora tengchongensis]
MPKKRIQLSPTEELARASIEQTLGVPVVQHDDQSRTSMHDLQIIYPDRPPAPVEVTSDVDGEALGTLNSLPKFDDGFWEASSLRNSWILHTISKPPLKLLHKQAEGLLSTLEKWNVSRFDECQVQTWDVDRRHGVVGAQHRANTARRLRALGVRSADAIPIGPYGPRIGLMMELGGGVWNWSADAVVQWIDAFMADTANQDNRSKLASTESVEAHLAVYAHMNSVDWPVWRSLEDHTELATVPTMPPTLVAPITHLWLIPAPWHKTGIAWNKKRGWYRFSLAI